MNTRELREELRTATNHLAESVRSLSACNEKLANACLHACAAVKTANELNVRLADTQKRVIELERHAAVDKAYILQGKKR